MRKVRDPNAEYDSEIRPFRDRSDGPTSPLKLVSVIMATNRMSPFLVEALESVHLQTYTQWELFVVDDGCPDREELSAVLANYPQVRLISSRRGNVSIARNIGASLATGELLAFIDDDDVWHPQLLDLAVQQFACTPGAVAGYSGMESIDSNGKRISESRQFEADLHQIVRRDVGIMLPNFVILRSVFQQIGGFHSGLRYAEDLDLVLRAALVGKFVFIDSTLVSYRTHPNNVTRNHRELAASIRAVLRLHRSRAQANRDRDLSRDFTISLRKNRRFAGWSAFRQLKVYGSRRRALAALSELYWIAKFAPDLPFLVIGHRLSLME